MFLSVIQTAICMFGTLLFACAALRKLRSFEDFSVILANYQLLPVGWTRAVATVLPLTELLIAFALLLAPVRTPGLCGAIVLTLVFASAVALNIYRGRGFIDCGCVAPSGGRTSLHWGLVTRNLIFAAAFSWCVLRRQQASNGIATGIACLAGINAYLLYSGYEALAVIAKYPRPRLSDRMRELAWQRHRGAAG